MKSILRDKFEIIFTFIIFYILVEIVTFIWIDFSFLPTDFLIDIVIAFSIASITFLIKSKKASIIYLSVFFGIILLLFLVNATMYNVYYDLFTIYQLQLLGEATEVINIEHISFLSIVVALGIGGLYYLTMRYINRRLYQSSLPGKKYYPRGIACFLISVLSVFTFFSIGAESIEEYLTDSNVTAFKRSSLEKYGILGYYTKEIEDLLERNDDDIIYPTDNDDISSTTDYFGLLEDMNVITILLESVQSFAVNETLTPNLYMLAEEGLYFDNSYSENKTNVSELIAITGNYPMTPVNFESSTYDFSYGMPSVLSDLGYTTTYLHDNLATFYDRGLLMPNLGFENLYLHEELYPGQEIYGWSGDYTLDSLTMAEMLPYISTTDGPFYSYWATLSSHGPYDYGAENKLLFDEMGYFDAIDQAEADGIWVNCLADYSDKDAARIRHYQAAVMDLDVAIGMMLDQLEEQGILDETVIVLYGDHNVYYHEIYMKRFDGNNDISNMDMYTNYFAIYNPTLTETYLELSGDDDSTISKFVTPYNIVPTLYDLLGIEYNENLFMGSSIFSDTEDVFYSIKLTSFFNANLFSDDGEEIIYYKNEYTEEELTAFIEACQLLREKMDYINNVYTSTKEIRGD